MEKNGEQAYSYSDIFVFMGIRQRSIVLFSLGLTALLFFNSCAMKKKGSSGPLYGTVDKSRTSRPGKAPLTDVSGSNRGEYSKNTLDNYAKLLGVDARNLNRSKDLYYFIDNWMGIPHRMGGLDRRGVDCSAFVGMVYQQVFGKDLPRTSRDMADNVKRKYERQLQEGDLVFFSFGGRQVDHVGIYLQNGKFVHVSTKKGVIISNLKDPWYYKYFTRAGSPKV